MNQYKFINSYFCVTRGGKAFSEVIRVDTDTEECPEGTQKCSDATSPENTVCYPNEELADSCPITQILFVDSADIEQYEDTTTYSVVKINVAQYIVYSKTSTDNLPITSTSVEGGTPCINPNQRSEDPSLLFPAEYDALVPQCE